MSRSNLVPRNVATCMHVIRELRNVSEYEAKTTSSAETHIIEGAVRVIRGWALERGITLTETLAPTKQMC
jgi:hypothetical protein